MKAKARDRELIEAMRRYFEAKAELAELRVSLERARRITDEDIARFYDPRTNPAHADEIMRSHLLKTEMRSLMDRAEDWARRDVRTSADELADEVEDADLPTSDEAAGSRLP